jgi:membrane-associated phospholipid phosphatase
MEFGRYRDLAARPGRRKLARCLAATWAACLGACSSVPHGNRWGESVGVPTWQRVGESAWQAATNPAVWVPLAAAGAMQIDNLDHRVSRWAIRETPVFGSQSNAANWSDHLRSAAVVAGWASILGSPDGPLDGDWAIDKLKGSAVDIAAAESAIEFTAGMQRVARRGRPIGYTYPGDNSMPSDHATTAAVYDAIAAQNLALGGAPSRLQAAADVGLGAITIATGWARIEAGAHFPSDTLIGGAIGEFFANFFTAAFFSATHSANRRIDLTCLPDGMRLQAEIRY